MRTQIAINLWMLPESRWFMLYNIKTHFLWLVLHLSWGKEASWRFPFWSIDSVAVVPIPMLVSVLQLWIVLESSRKFVILTLAVVVCSILADIVRTDIAIHDNYSWLLQPLFATWPMVDGGCLARLNYSIVDYVSIRR